MGLLILGLVLLAEAVIVLLPSFKSQTQKGISVEEAAQLMPLYPTHMSATMKEGVVLVKWRGTGEDVDYYEILRKTSSIKAWVQITRVKAVGDNREWYEWKDSTINSGTPYIYGVRAVNVYGTHSIISESAIIASP